MEEKEQIKKIKSIIDSEKYDFLRTDEHINKRIMLLTLGGSYSYGTNVSQYKIDEETGEPFYYESDIDLRGIISEGPKEIIGLSNYEQFENKETDTVLYSFRKIVELMMNCNPNTVEILGTKKSHVFYMSEEGKLLKNNIDLFLSKRAVNSFGGYANAQLRRLQNALARDSYPQKEKEKHVLGSLNIQMDHFKRHYQKFTDGDIKLYLDKSEKIDFEEEIFMDINMKHYPLRDFKNIYSEMSNLLNDYGKLNKRNKKKDEIHLLKHAMHLIRLFIMGSEILEGKGVNTYRGNDRELLLSIRNGNYTYEQIFEMVDKYEKRFLYAKDHTCLPDNPDYKAIEELVMQINRSLLKKYNIF